MKAVPCSRENWYIMAAWGGSLRSCQEGKIIYEYMSDLQLRGDFAAPSPKPDNVWRLGRGEQGGRTTGI